MNKRSIEVLIKTGAFDHLGQNRPTLLQNMDRALEYVSAIAKSKEGGQNSLFEEVGEKEFVDFKFEEVEDMPQMEKLNQEMECIGIYVSGHPLDDYRKTIENCATLTSQNLEREAKNAAAERAAIPESERWRKRDSGKQYVVVGMITGLRAIHTKKGDEMAFAKIQDFTGFIDITFFPKTWGALRSQIKEGDVIGLKGKLDVSRDTPSFLVDEVADLDSLKEHSIQEVHIQLKSDIKEEIKIHGLRDFLFAKQGSCLVYFHIDTTQGMYIVKASPQLRIPCDKNFIAELNEQEEVQEVWLS